ncbi:hypothetical protein DFR55_10485 [Herbinix hemicellulosilytica]|uniref:Putative membrane protein n=1 Tax=Herbinix hemicellulosilytica TaxID=1564487 RepID=A0A0H5SI87_HERHM|nr:hypothetical protein [Herbinix hemicellulosilytica]RBP59829.1 hypothetical protein DFR55_10485 [Herbinix hemicellulosilytica]CRZ35217.1 putative membrane protein [Herbinix hemicellulosilytica]
MKKSAGRIFFKGFLLSLIFFALFLGIGILSYQIVMDFFNIENEAVEVAEIITSDKKQSIITEARLDDVSKHLIFCVDEDDGSIKKLLLEIFNCHSNKMYYFTIPIKTRFTLSSSLHKELVLVKPSIPQFLKLSAITTYIQDDTAYEYSVLMIEDLLDISISYYSVVPQSIYDSVFTTEKIGLIKDSNDISDKYPREIFSQDFIEFLGTIKTESELRKYIEEIYGKIKSNLKFEDKLNYMESYLNTAGENIYFEVIAGKDSNSEYTVDKEAAKKQVEACLGE